jgi:hypothetical protein
MTEFWMPQVTIYLNRSVDNCLKNLDSNSRVYSKDLLTLVENNYKKLFSKKYGEQVHLLQFDSNEAINFEDVLSELEGVNLDDMKKNDKWRIRRETDINYYRSW